MAQAESTEEHGTDQTGQVADTWRERLVAGPQECYRPKPPRAGPSSLPHRNRCGSQTNSFHFLLNKQNFTPRRPPKYLMPGPSSHSSEILFLFFNFNLIFYFNIYFYYYYLLLFTNKDQFANSKVPEKSSHLDHTQQDLCTTDPF